MDVWASGEGNGDPGSPVWSQLVFPALDSDLLWFLDQQQQEGGEAGFDIKRWFWMGGWGWCVGGGYLSTWPVIVGCWTQRKEALWWCLDEATEELWPIFSPLKLNQKQLLFVWPLRSTQTQKIPQDLKLFCFQAVIICDWTCRTHLSPTQHNMFPYTICFPLTRFKFKAASLFFRLTDLSSLVWKRVGEGHPAAERRGDARLSKFSLSWDKNNCRQPEQIFIAQSKEKPASVCT